MSRSGYSDDLENWSMIRWRGAVSSSIRGKKGQSFLREALAALDALPEAALIQNDLRAEGSFCTLGAIGAARGTPLDAVDPDDHEAVAGLFAIPHALACEIMWENDEGAVRTETPRARWERMRAWIVHHLKNDQPSIPRAAITPTPDTPTAEVAVQPVTRSGRPNSLQNQGDPQ